MKVTETAAGTPVIESTKEEYDAYLERQVQREMDMSVAKFTDAYLAGKIDSAHPASGYLVGLLQLGQNGQRPAS